MIEICCGLKGGSRAFAERGWDVVTVDNNPLFKPTILADISDLSLRGERYEFAWASPPCTEYAKRRFDPSIEPSLGLVLQSLRLIKQLRAANPDLIWCLENVRLSVPFISKVLGPHRLAVGPYFLWGNFPLFIADPVKGKGGVRGPHWLRSAKRAEIPKSLSSNMEEAVSYILDQAARRHAAPASGRGGEQARELPALEPAHDRFGAPARAPQDRPQ